MNDNNENKFLSNSLINNNQNEDISQNIDMTNNNINTNNNMSSNSNLTNNKEEKYNPYKDYLPENRIKKESDGVSNKVAKYGLYPFYALVIIVMIAGIFWFNGSNILKTKKRIYNMNLTETINLDTIYSSDEVEWVSNSDNVTIENNVVTALKSGEVYVYAKEDNKIVSDATFYVLTGEEAISLDNHAISTTVGDKTSVTITRNKDAYNEEKEKSPKEILTDYIKNIYHTIVPKNETNENNTTNNKNDNTENNNQNTNENNNQGNSSSTNSNYNNDDDDDFDDDDFDDDDFDDDDDDFDDDDFDDDDDDLDNDDDYGDLEFESSDESVAIVDEDGNIETIAPGVAEIIVRDSNGNEDHTVITVVEDDITLYNEEYTLYKEDDIPIGYSLSSNTYTEEDIKWSSENPSVATVNNDGEITAVEIGSTNIIITVGDIEKIVKVTVKDDITLPEDIEISATSIGIMVGQDQTVTANIIPEDVSDSTLTWTSNDTNIATVNNGTIIGKSEGSTIVSVTTSNGIRKEISVTVTKKTIPPESIELSNDTMNMLVGSTKKLEYTLKPNGATDNDTKVTYDQNYISIDENNNIKALKSGTTTVTITTSNGKGANITITITDPIIDLKTIKINEGNLNLQVGDTSQLNVIFDPINATNKELVWTSSNTKVATIDSTGRVVAIGEGTATITVTSSKNKNITNTITVTVKKVVNNIPVTTLTLNKTSLNLETGGTDKLIATVNSDATNKNVTWESSNPKLVTVDANGRVLAYGAGTAVITVTSASNPSIQSTCTVTVIVPVGNIQINEGNLNLQVGDTKKLSITISPETATNKEITWTSSNTKVAAIDADGNIKAISEGTTTITAISSSNKNMKNSITVTVKKVVTNVPVKSLDLNKVSLSLSLGKTEKLIAAVNSDATNKELTWTSSNPKIATVDANGNVKAIGGGTTTVTVSSTSNPSIKKTCTVTVTVPVTSIKINEGNINLNTGATATLTVTFNPTNTSNKNITWASSDTKVATIDTNGNVKAVGEGTATITATSSSNKNITNSITVTVKKVEGTVPVTSITLSSSSLSLVIGESSSLTATVAPNNATNKEITWTSSDPSIATVSQKGKVTGKKYGTTTITATCDKKTSKLTVKVYKEYIDLALFWGQSNMVGRAGINNETTTSNKSEIKNIDKDIIKNYQTYANTTVSMKAGVVYEYKALTDSLVDVSTNPTKFGEYIKYQNGKMVSYDTKNDTYRSIDKSSGTNMIPYFAKTYYEKSNRKLVIVHTAHGGRGIANFLPNKSEYIYEAMTTKYKKAVSYLNKNGYLIKNRFYVVYQGENDSSSSAKSQKYYDNYINVHNNLKKDLNLSFGAIVYTVRSGYIDEVKRVHAAQENLIKNNNDIILGTDFVYKEFMANNTTIFCPGSNSIHVNSAGLSQVGRNVATNVVKKLNGTLKEEIVSAESIEASNKTLNMTVGETKKIGITIKPSTTTNKDVFWASSNTQVATIDTNGNVKALSEGTTTITATSASNQNITSNITVTVKKVEIIPVTSITLNSGKISIEKGKTAKLVATVNPTNATNKNITWVSSNTKVATVDAKGNIKAIAPGTSTITVTSNTNSTIKATCTVTVPKPIIAVTTIEFNPNNKYYDIDINKTATLKYKVTPSNANQAITCTSSDTTIVTTDAYCHIKGIDGGTAKITVKAASGKSDTIRVRVKNNINKFKVLGTIKMGSKRVSSVPSSTFYGTSTTSSQGLAVTGNYYIYSKVGGSVASLQIYDKSKDKVIKSIGVKKTLGHANGITYNPNDGNIYIVMTKDKNYRAIKLSDLKKEKSNFSSGAFLIDGKPVRFSAISYDSSNKKYYLASGSYIYVYNSPNTNPERKIKKIQSDTGQDIGSYNGRILVIRYNGANAYTSTKANATKNAIDVYNSSNGAYLGTYIIRYNGEIESIAYSESGKKFIVITNSRTKENGEKYEDSLFEITLNIP